jgi:transposase
MHSDQQRKVVFSKRQIFHRCAGFETRVVHPFATKQYRTPADPGNKTDETDLYAQHRAAVAGFGLREVELEPAYRALQLRARHRRKLVEKFTAMRIDADR